MPVSADLAQGSGGDLLAQRTASFEPDPASAGAARRLLQDALQAADRLRWVDAGALALSEVVTNAALHAHTPFDVVIEVRIERLRVEVRDANPALPQQRRYDMRATTGRGLALVAAVTRECGVHSFGSHGKVVWFSLGDDAAEESTDDLLAAWDVDGDWERSEEVAPQTQEVVLEGMPATLWLATRQHHTRSCGSWCCASLSTTTCRSPSLSRTRPGAG